MQVARAFIRDMRAFHAEPNAIKRDEIASRQLHALREFVGIARQEAVHLHDDEIDLVECQLLNRGAHLVVAKLNQISFCPRHFVCAQGNGWHGVVQIRILRYSAGYRHGLSGACGKDLRNLRQRRHKRDRMDPTSPSSRRAGWLGLLSLKPDHCGSPNRIRAGYPSIPEMVERKLTVLPIIGMREEAAEAERGL